MIQVNGLTKDYGARRAIDDLTFDAEQGEIVGFLGPNGAGKTTTMRILTGYMPPTDGTATVAGYDIVEESLEVRKRVGYLPETVPLYNDMTALEYLKFMADLRKIPDSEERAYETLERGSRQQLYRQLLQRHAATHGLGAGLDPSPRSAHPR
jgi:ABC-2 type transport system ATP-binding protein